MKKRVKIPTPFEIRYVDEKGEARLDKDGNPSVDKFTARTFATNAMGTCDAFMKSGYQGLAAFTRVDTEILTALNSGAEFFELHAEDFDPLFEHIKNTKEFPFTEVLGPVNMLRFVEPWFQATDVQEEMKEAAE